MGTETLERLRPDPVLRELTYDRFERACLMLGPEADPEAMFRGEVSLDQIKTPRLSEAPAFLELLLENYSRYDTRKMAPDRVEALLALVVSTFFFLSSGHWPGIKSIETT